MCGHAGRTAYVQQYLMCLRHGLGTYNIGKCSIIQHSNVVNQGRLCPHAVSLLSTQGKTILLYTRALDRIYCYTIYNMKYTICNIQCTIYNIQYTIYNIQYTIYNIQYTIYNIQYTIYNIQYTIYNIQYTIYNIQYTIYNIQYTIHTSNKNKGSV